MIFDKNHHQKLSPLAVGNHRMKTSAHFFHSVGDGRTGGDLRLCYFTKSTIYYPLVNIQKAIENGHLYIYIYIHSYVVGLPIKSGDCP